MPVPKKTPKQKSSGKMAGIGGVSMANPRPSLGTTKATGGA